MKRLSLLLAMFSMGTTPIFGEDSAKKSLQQMVSFSFVEDEMTGDEAISKIRASYEKGEYKEFLKAVDDRYQQDLLEGKVDLLAAKRPGLSKELQQWEEKEKILQEKRDQELIQLLSSFPIQETSSLLAKKVLFAASKRQNPIQEGAIHKMALYRQMPLNSGRSHDENLIIAIDLEYEYKAIHLDLPDGASFFEKRAKQCALKMEKLDCLKDISRQVQDERLKESLDQYIQTFDQRLAQSWDMADLHRLINGQKKPSSAFEEKVAEILIRYHDQLSEATHQMMGH